MIEPASLFSRSSSLGDDALSKASSLPHDDLHSISDDYDIGTAAYINRGLVPATERYAQATVLYMDIVDFTRHCMAKPLDEISDWMTRIHGTIDGLLERYGVRKVETRGDCVICVSGTNFVAESGGTSRDLCGDQAARMLSFAHDLGTALSAIDGTAARMGMASGPVVLTHIAHGGDALPAKYIYGDTVNVACRMEQTGRVGAVQLEETAARTYARERGVAPPPLHLRDVKGRGEMRVALYDYSAGAGRFLEHADVPATAAAPVHKRSSRWAGREAVPCSRG
jgi:class 3 adenylate cyclase